MQYKGKLSQEYENVYDVSANLAMWVGVLKGFSVGGVLSTSGIVSEWDG